MVPIVTGPIPVLIQFDSKSKRAKKPRQVKRFDNGLDRKAKDFYLQMAREGRHPIVLSADLEPVFAPGSRYTTSPPPTDSKDHEPTTLFDNTPVTTNMPDGGVCDE